MSCDTRHITYYQKTINRSWELKKMIAFYRLKLLLYRMKVLVWCLWYVEGGRRSPCPEVIVKSTPNFFYIVNFLSVIIGYNQHTFKIILI